MILFSLILFAVGAGLATILAGRIDRRAGQVIGIGAAAAVTLLALGLSPTESAQVGGMTVASSALIRVVAGVWASSLAVLALLDVLIDGAGLIAGPGLIGLGVAVLALSLPDPSAAFAALAAGGVPAVLVPGLGAWVGRPDNPDRVATVRHGAAAVIGASSLAILVVAWGLSPAGPLGLGEPVADDPQRAVALGLGLLVLAAAVIVRAGLIPAHLWAARFMEEVSSLSIPAALSWPTAAFFLVALTWSQAALGSPTAAAWLEHGLITIAAVGSIAFGGLAAVIHDDIEHVLGYSIVQDAGVALLAFASLRPEASAAARDWLIASAVLKTALAAWVATTRWTFDAHRLPELRGWARQAPALGVALVTIAIGAVGLPGMAAFEARTTLAFGAVPGTLGSLVLIPALTSIVYFGRILAVGLQPMSAAVSRAPSPVPRWVGARSTGWSGSVARIFEDIPALARANRAPVAAGLVVVLAAIGFVVAATGVSAS